MSSTTGVQAELAALVALHVARDGEIDSDQIFTLSLDDFGWTSAWLGSGTRADYLQIKLSESGLVHIRVIESKSAKPGPRINCDQHAPPFSEGIEQVRKTILTLNQIFNSLEPTLDEDLRFASLIEQFMASVLSKSSDMAEKNRAKIFKLINNLSSRKISPTIDGIVVLTQAGASEDDQERQDQITDDGIKVVAVGRREVEKALGIRVNPKQQDKVSAKINQGLEQPSSSLPNIKSLDKNNKDSNKPVRSLNEGSNSANGNISVVDEVTKPNNNDNFLNEKYQDLAKKLISAAVLQKVDVDGSDPEFILEGPALITIGIKLKEGSSIQPFRARLPDIARDIGMGDKADFILVENDSKPRTVRVILPRSEKNIPPVPFYESEPVVEEGYLPIYIGQTVDGKDFRTSVESWPHMLVAGSTGSGKTTLLKTILNQLSKYAGDYAEFLITDGKGETDYMNLIPEYGYVKDFPGVQLGADSALKVLQWAEEEMERRREYILELHKSSSGLSSGINAITIFKDSVMQNKIPPIKPLIVVVDEFADIVISSKKNAELFETLIQRISQVGRSRMIHLLLATQRPDKETIRGAIKANLNARVVLQLPTQADSMTVLGQSGAEKLLRPGDFLFQRGSGSMIRLQGYSI